MTTDSLRDPPPPRAAPVRNTLQVVTSYRCPLRCSYCPTFKADLSMSSEVAHAVCDRFFPQDDPRASSAIRTIRFFGAEPLTEPEIIAGMLDDLRRRLGPDRYAGLRFKVTTNGTCFDDPSVIDLLTRRPELELTLSIDGPPAVQAAHRHGGGDASTALDWFFTHHAWLLTRQPAPVVNLAIAPDQAAHLVESFRWLHGQGLRRFNLLPAYFVPWSDDETRALDDSFARLGSVLVRMWRKGMTVSLHNVFVNAASTFYNQDLVADVDGELYADNAVLMAALRPFRPELRIGSVLNAAPLSAPAACTEDLLARVFPPDVLASTRLVDASLSRFVEDLLSHDPCPRRR